MASPFDDGPDYEQEDGPVAVARSLSGADEDEGGHEVEEPTEAKLPPNEIEQAASDDGSQYAAPVRQDTSGPNDEQLDPEQQYAQAPAGAGSGEEEVGAVGGMKAPVLPTAPQLGDNADNFRALEARFSKFNPQDYKPSIGRRIAAGLAGGAVAFGSRNPGEGMKVADRINSAPLDRAQAQLESDVRPIQQRITDTNAQNQQGQQRFANDVSRYGLQERDLTNQARIGDWNAQAKQRTEMAQAKLNTVDKNTLGPVDPNNPFGEWQGKTPGGQVVRGLEPPAAIQKSPGYIRQQRTADLQAMDKNGIKMTPQDRKFYFANGKLAQPQERISISNPSEKLEEYRDWKTKFQSENGRPPNAAETVSFGARQGGAVDRNLHDRIEATKDKMFDLAQRSFGATKDASQYHSDLQIAQNEYENRMADAGVQVPHMEITVDPNTGAVKWGDQPTAQQTPSGGARPSQPAATPPQQAPQAVKVQSGKTVKVGDPVTSNGKTGVVTRINPQTQKPIVRWQSGAQ
jgi:hypothetical protein